MIKKFILEGLKYSKHFQSIRRIFIYLDNSDKKTKFFSSTH